MDEHIWTVESRHPTSEGLTIYEACPCGARRIRELPWARSAQLVSGPAPAPSTGRS